MKKYIYLFLLVITTLVSCSDAYDFVQESELNEETAYASLQDLKSGLVGVYSAYGVNSEISFNAAFTDNVKKGFDSNGQSSDTYNFILQTGSGAPNSLWSSRYTVINLSNRVLRSLDRLYPSFSEDEKLESDKLRGHLLAMRALCHFDLFQYFTPDYQNMNGLSIINFDFVPNPDDSFERNTVQETLNFIKSDLNQAVSLIGSGLTDFDGTFYMSQDAVKFLQAKVALYSNDLATAQTIAEEVLAAHPLADVNSYENMFKDLVDGESIFSLARFNGNSQVAGLFYFNSVSISGNPYLEVSNGLEQVLSPDDIRRSVVITPDSDVPNNIILINKYPGKSDGLLLNHIKLFRSSEMKLIIAECQARNSQFTMAAQTLNELRTARYVVNPPTVSNFTSVSQALTEILLERRKEFCFEGHRYLDIKRFNADLNIGINRESIDCASFSASCNLPFNDYRFTFPIPSTELDANNIITQNPNYSLN